MVSIVRFQQNVCRKGKRERGERERRNSVLSVLVYMAVPCAMEMMRGKFGQKINS